jgi:hypothetical protein
MCNTILKKNVKKLVYLLGVISLLLFSACNNTYTTTIIQKSNDSNDSNGSGGSGDYADTITAVDGYIKDASVSDAGGQTGTYIADSNGKYGFPAKITYPVTLTGGTLIKSGLPFDISMSASKGNVISPFTTFLGDDDALREQLTNQGFGSISTLEGFSIDYISESKKIDLAKAAQVFYVILKNEKLTNAFKKELKASKGASRSTAIFTVAESAIVSVYGGDSPAQVFLSAVIDYYDDDAEGPAGLEKYIKTAKEKFQTDFKD